MGEGLAHGPYPYPFYPPGAPFPGAPGMLPPGAPLPPLGPYGPEAGMAPFPPGMPVPLPPEVAEELAAQQAAQQAALQQQQAAEPAVPAAEPAAEVAEQVVDAAAVAPQAAAQAQQPVAEQPAVPAAPGFLSLARHAYECLPASAQRPPNGPSAARGQRPRSPAFDADAAAAELERRWRASAPHAVPCSSLPRPQQPSQPPTGHEALARGGKGGSSASLSSKGGLGGSSGSLSGKACGRTSPAAGVKPVVVAVRAWSTDDAAGDTPKWKIASAVQQLQAAAVEAGGAGAAR